MTAESDQCIRDGLACNPPGCHLTPQPGKFAALVIIAAPSDGRSFGIGQLLNPAAYNAFMHTQISGKSRYRVSWLRCLPHGFALELRGKYSSCFCHLNATLRLQGEKIIFQRERLIKKLMA